MGIGTRFLSRFIIFSFIYNMDRTGLKGTVVFNTDQKYVVKHFFKEESYQEEKSVIQKIIDAAKIHPEFERIIKDHTLIDLTLEDWFNDTQKTIKYIKCLGIDLRNAVNIIKNPADKPDTLYLLDNKKIQQLHNYFLLVTDAMLNVAHGLYKYCNLLHKDLHLGNVMLCNYSVKVIDFGNAIDVSKGSYIGELIAIKNALSDILKKVFPIQQSKTINDFSSRVSNFISVQLKKFYTPEEALDCFQSSFGSEVRQRKQLMESQKVDGGSTKSKYMKTKMIYTGRDKVKRIVYTKNGKSYVRKWSEKDNKYTYRVVTLL